MAHTDDTQARSENMPKIPHTLVKPSGIFSFNARYPRELIEGGLVEREFSRRTLGTRDWREAKKLAAQEYVLHLAEVERLLAKLNGGKKSHTCAKTINLSDLSSRHQRDIVLKQFVEMERKAALFRKRVSEEGGEARELAFATAIEDLAEFEGKGAFSRSEWIVDACQFLEREGIQLDPNDVPEEFLTLYQRAVIEVQWRTVEALQGRTFEKRDDVFRSLHSFTETQGSTPKRRTVADICREFLEVKSSANRAPATLKKYIGSLDVLKELVGEDADLSIFDQDQGERGYQIAKEIVGFLPKIVRNSRQTYPGLTLREASKVEAKVKNPRFIETKTQHHLLNGFRSVFILAVNRRWVSFNPFSNLQESLSRVINRGKEVLSGDELTALLSSEEFLKERESSKRNQARQERFWCVILCLYHGTRLNEAASLLVSDIKEDDGIPYLDFVEFDDEGNAVKRLKTTTSRRRVPIHEEVIKIGFLDYVEQRRSQDSVGWLFPDVVPDSLGNRGAKISKWFGRIRNKILGKQIRRGDKSIHSFRHAVADAVRSITDSDEILFEIGGWGKRNGQNSSRNYGKGDLKRLKKVVDQIGFKGFDPAFLYPNNSHTSANQ